MSRVLLTVLMWCVVCVGATAGERFALVIGNDRYVAINPLANAAADARLISQTLRTLGFEVTERYDATRDDMLSAMSALQTKVQSSGAVAPVVIIYFAGHGVQIDGKNYLLPVETRPDETFIRNSAIPAASFLNVFQDAGARRNILVLDACRNDPWEGQALRPKRGLAEIEVRGDLTGTLIAYATAPGAEAADGAAEAANGPYAQALAEAFALPGFAAETMFREVSRRVAALTADQQVPWVSSSLLDRIVFVEGDDAKSRATYDVATEAAAWTRAQRARTVADIDWFLRRFPAGVYADAAHALRASLISAAQAAELRRAGAEAGFGVYLRLRSISADRPALEVVQIAEDSPLFGQLLPGDTIMQANHRAITAETDPADFLIQTLGQRRTMSLLIRRGGATYEIAVRH
jgi:uncharacterized caspase-like protein